MKAPVYLDHNATTPMDPRVLTVWHRTAQDHFGNPASASHAYGWAAEKVVAQAREHVANFLGATPSEIIFTSGATEANNLALQGVAEAYAGRGRKAVLTSNIEHPSVTEPLAHLAAADHITLSTLSAAPDGLIEADEIGARLDEKTLLVSLISVQNEVGTIQPVAKVGAMCRAAGVIFHTDAAQVIGRDRLDVNRDQLDLVSLSSHKLYGPKGVGALYVRRRSPRVTLAARSFGGGQENNLRPGTLNVPAIAAFGEACQIVLAEGAAENHRVEQLRQQLWHLIKKAIPTAQLNGHPTQRHAGNLNVSFSGVPAGRLLPALKIGRASCRERV